MSGLRKLPALLLCLCLAPTLAPAGQIRIAVAANFASTLKDLVEVFTVATGHHVLISSGSTGKHYAQIRNGAAFDIFLAADAERPLRLEKEGIGLAGRRFAYAQGRLVLWVPGKDRLEPAQDYLAQGEFRHLAIANPRLAPYGLAARQVLQAWQLWDGLQSRLVRGENVAQAYQFVATGNAEAGLLALSQVLAGDAPRRGAHRVIPASLHAPITQYGLLLRPGAAAEAFVQFLQGEQAAHLIRAAGYGVPARS